MRRRLYLYACAFASALCGATAFAVGAGREIEPAPTTDQIYAAFDDADHAKVLRHVSAALAVKGDAAHAYDRYELFTLRGETQLRLKNVQAAVAAFEEAARNTKLEEKAAVARATAELIRRSKKGVYSSPAKDRKAAPASFDVADVAARRQAFEAMFEDARPGVGAAVKAAKQAEKLPAMLEAFALLRDLKALEIASTGEETRSAEMAVDLGNRARAVMDKAVLDMGKTVVAIEQAATREVKDSAMVAGRVVPVGAGVAGLTPEDIEVLKRIALDCDEVRRMTVGLRSLYEAGGDEEAALKKLHADAQAVAGQARTILGIRWRDYYAQWAEVGPGAATADESFWDQMPQGRTPRPGTNTIQRPAHRGNPSAGPRGVNTGGPR